MAPINPMVQEYVLTVLVTLERERGWIGNRGTVNKEENELVPQDLQNVLLAKVCSTYTKENVLKEANILFWFGQNNTSSSIQPMMLISLDIS